MGSCGLSLYPAMQPVLCNPLKIYGRALFKWIAWDFIGWHFCHINTYHLKVSNTFSKYSHNVNQNTKSLTLTPTSFLKETCLKIRHNDCRPNNGCQGVMPCWSETGDSIIYDSQIDISEQLKYHIHTRWLHRDYSLLNLKFKLFQKVKLDKRFMLMLFSSDSSLAVHIP